MSDRIIFIILIIIKMESIMNLSPVSDFIHYNCESELSTAELYENEVSRAIDPILIWMVRGLDYVCMFERLYLCVDEKTYIVDFCVPDMAISLDRCPLDKYRFIICSIGLRFTKNNQPTKNDHSESIIIDTFDRTIDFFEPYSSSAPWYSTVSEFLRLQFSMTLPGYRFKDTFEYCPYYGPQTIIKLPICGAITLLYILLRIYNSNLTSYDVINLIMNLESIALLHTMRKFICYIRNISVNNELRRLQNVRFYLSKILVNEPDKMNIVENYYYNSDFWGLVKYISNSPLLESQLHEFILKNH
jgi:hypothetical protein